MSPNRCRPSLQNEHLTRPSTLFDGLKAPRVSGNTEQLRFHRALPRSGGDPGPVIEAGRRGLAGTPPDHSPGAAMTVERKGATDSSYVRGQGGRRVCPSAGERAVGENRPKLRGGGSGALRRRLIRLLSAGWLPPSVSSSRGFPRSNDGRRAWPGHRAVAGSSPPFSSAPDAAQRNGSVFSLMRERPFVRSPTRKRPSRGRSPPRRPAASCRRR